MGQEKEPVGWVTVNGNHVPIFEGESKEDAVARSIGNNEDKKNEQIAKNKKQADKLNGKKSVSEDELKSQSTDWWYNKLSDSERKVILDAQYSTKSVNEYLRGARKLDGSAKSDMEETVHTLDSALSKFKTDSDIVTYRGVNSEEFTNTYLGISPKTVGIKSSSYAKSRAEAFAKNQGGYIIEYHIKAGNHGADVNGVPGANESEFLIRHNMTQKVIAKPDKNTIIVVVG